MDCEPRGQAKAHLAKGARTGDVALCHRGNEAMPENSPSLAVGGHCAVGQIPVFMKLGLCCLKKGSQQHVVSCPLGVTSVS